MRALSVKQSASQPSGTLSWSNQSLLANISTLQSRIPKVSRQVLADYSRKTVLTSDEALRDAVARFDGRVVVEKLTTIPRTVTSGLRQGVFRVDWLIVVTTILLATTITVDATTTNYVLFHAPLEVYLLSRAFVLPISLCLVRMFWPKNGFILTAGVVCPSIALSMSVIMAAVRPELPHPRGVICMSILSSTASAAWPLLVQRLSQSRHTISIDGYEEVNLNQSKPRNDPSKSGLSISRLLYFTSLLSFLFVLPPWRYSDELGHIKRNCFILDQQRLRIYLSFGAVCRISLFISAILLVRATSAQTTTFFCVLAVISQAAFLTFDELLPTQRLGLAMCALSGFWYFWNAHPYLARISGYFSGLRKSKWQDTNPAFRLIFRLLLVVVAGLVLLGTLSRMQNAKHVTDLSWLNDKEENGDFPPSPYTPMALGVDGYLGERPRDDTIADITLLVEQCRGSFKEMQHVRNVSRCLEYLSTQQQNYSTLSIYRRSNGNIAERSTMALIASDEENTIPKCDGPVIPYHLWWSGLPTWRLELFIKSYLYTQNLACSRLWIWINGDRHPEGLESFEQDPRFVRFKPLVERGYLVLKKWRLPAQVALWRDTYERNRMLETIVTDSSGHDWLQLYTGQNQITFFSEAASDIARFVILHMYGGVYISADIVLLRDMRPLILHPSTAFSGRLGLDNRTEAYDNSVMALPANSSLSAFAIHCGITQGLNFNQIVIGRTLVWLGWAEKDSVKIRGMKDKSKNSLGLGLKKLETPLFDPVWAETQGLREGKCTVPCLPSLDSIFKAAPIKNEWISFEGERFGGASYNRTMENFFRGAWGYRIHGQVRYDISLIMERVNFDVFVMMLTSLKSGIPRTSVPLGWTSSVAPMIDS